MTTILLHSTAFFIGFFLRDLWNSIFKRTKVERPKPQPRPTPVNQPRPKPKPIGYRWDWSPVVDENGTLTRPLKGVTITLGKFYTAWGFGDTYDGFEAVGLAVNNALTDDQLPHLGFGSSNYVYGAANQNYGDFTLKFISGVTIVIPMESRF